MALLSKVFKIALATAVGLVIGVGTQAESQAEGNQYLCMTKPNACEYAPYTAPQLNADVCYDGFTAVLKGAGDCAPNAFAFYVDSGEVIDPQTGTVQPYIALADACAMNFCVNSPNPPPGTEGPMCCEASSGDCVESDGICPPDKVAVWCPDGHEGALQNGEWVCEE